MIEARYIHADEAESYISQGWDVEPLYAHWPYCLAARQTKAAGASDDATGGSAASAQP